MLRKMRHDWKAIMWRPFWLVVYFVSVSCMSQLPSINTSLPETPLQPSPPPPPPPPPLPDMSLCEIYLQSPDQNFASQMPWFCMCSTCTHKKGEKGARGDRGIQGNPGLSGPKGPTGFGGPQGNVGMQGIKGEKGDSGDKGDFGLVGPMGSKGEQGIKGAKGDPGINGPIGDPGPKGDPGQCPQVRDIFQGPPGETGLPGPVGAPGLPGQNGQPGPRGLKGDQGVIGAPGIPGVMGQKGEHGIEGNCNCQNGTKGDTGLEGSKGNKGDVGVAGQQGNEGQKGQKGEQGDMGMMGIPGPCTPIVQSAFSVALTGSFPPPSQPVSFLKVIYNLQQHYNPTAGIYTAPINGTYVFSYNLVASTRALKVGLFWNFLPVVKTTQMTDLGTTSQQVVLHLSMGDWVWLQVRDSNSNGMFTNSEASSTFSGYLLNPDSCDMIMSREVSNPVIPDTFPWDDS